MLVVCTVGYTDCRRVDQSNITKSANFFQIQMNVIQGVVAGHKARQHARVGRVNVPCNESDTDSLFQHNPPVPRHAQHFEHMNVRVSTADQDQV
jgi:hypothetical protein